MTRSMVGGKQQTDEQTQAYQIMCVCVCSSNSHFSVLLFAFSLFYFLSFSWHVLSLLKHPFIDKRKEEETPLLCIPFFCSPLSLPVSSSLSISLYTALLFILHFRLSHILSPNFSHYLHPLLSLLPTFLSPLLFYPLKDLY